MQRRSASIAPVPRGRTPLRSNVPAIRPQSAGPTFRNERRKTSKEIIIERNIDAIDLKMNHLKTAILGVEVDMLPLGQHVLGPKGYEEYHGIVSKLRENDAKITAHEEVIRQAMTLEQRKAQFAIRHEMSKVSSRLEDRLVLYFNKLQSSGELQRQNADGTRTAVKWSTFAAKLSALETKLILAEEDLRDKRQELKAEQMVRR